MERWWKGELFAKKGPSGLILPGLNISGRPVKLKQKHANTVIFAAAMGMGEPSSLPGRDKNTHFNQ